MPRLFIALIYGAASSRREVALLIAILIFLGGVIGTL
jgi:hypothetical protein